MRSFVIENSTLSHCSDPAEDGTPLERHVPPGTRRSLFLAAS